jgi:hypothetical protein
MNAIHARSQLRYWPLGETLIVTRAFGCVKDEPLCASLATKPGPSLGRKSSRPFQISELP